jgi:uncharacterized protein (DUF885 family)
MPRFLPFLHSLLLAALPALLAVAGCSVENEPGRDSDAVTETALAPDVEASATRVKALADRYYAFALARSPEMAYFSGIEPDRHDGLFDNSPEARVAAEAEEDALLAELRSIDAAPLAGRTAWITHAYLEQQVAADIARRVCRNELWNVSQMGGWHTAYTLVAQYQPVGTPELRQQALARWEKFPAFIDQEVANLKKGLGLGYSAPQTVVRRVMGQLEGLLAIAPQDSPYSSPAQRDGDEAFSRAFVALVGEEILPALQRYLDHLAGEYLLQARAELSVLANPDGRACYEASLQAYTTLDRSPEEIYELGRRTVAANRRRVEELGLEAYGVEGFDAVMERVMNDPDDRFTSRGEMLEYASDSVARAQAEMPNWVGHMPAGRVEVVPYPEYQEASGVSARYEPGDGQRPGVYRISLDRPEEQTRSRVETTAFHETWPGHHLQVEFSQEIEGLHPVTRIIWFSGPGEGWARYSETLANEMGLYRTVGGPIARLAWPARGMVVDPGIHIMGWTREEAIEFMGRAGRMTDKELDDMVDRIAILPGQLTAYDSGGLEIFALREQAQEQLGTAFDIREFHDRVLENGTVPLTALRAHVEKWIGEKGGGR